MCDVMETLHLFAYSVASTCVKLLILQTLLGSHAAHELHQLQIKEYKKADNEQLQHKHQEQNKNKVATEQP